MNAAPTPLKPLPRQGFRVRIEGLLEANAEQTVFHTTVINGLAQDRVKLIEMWEATQSDAAPEFETSIRLVRAS